MSKAVYNQHSSDKINRLTLEPGSLRRAWTNKMKEVQEWIPEELQRTENDG